MSAAPSVSCRLAACLCSGFKPSEGDDYRCDNCQHSSELHKSIHDNLFCEFDNCEVEEGGPAVSYCLQCIKLSCQACGELHLSKGRGRTHQLEKLKSEVSNSCRLAACPCSGFKPSEGDDNRCDNCQHSSELHKSIHDNLFCEFDNCEVEEGGPAVSYCLQCIKLSCQACGELHLSKGRGRTHQLGNIRRKIESYDRIVPSNQTETKQREGESKSASKGEQLAAAPSSQSNGKEEGESIPNVVAAANVDTGQNSIDIALFEANLIGMKQSVLVFSDGGVEKIADESSIMSDEKKRGRGSAVPQKDYRECHFCNLKIAISVEHCTNCHTSNVADIVNLGASSEQISYDSATYFPSHSDMKQGGGGGGGGGGSMSAAGGGGSGQGSRSSSSRDGSVGSLLHDDECGSTQVDVSKTATKISTICSLCKKVATMKCDVSSCGLSFCDKHARDHEQNVEKLIEKSSSSASGGAANTDYSYHYCTPLYSIEIHSNNSDVEKLSIDLQKYAKNYKKIHLEPQERGSDRDEIVRDTSRQLKCNIMQVFKGFIPKLPDGEYRSFAESLKSKVMIFMSSTFDDTRFEQDEILGKCNVEIRKVLKILGYEYQMVTMRWGLSDEIYISNGTIGFCLRYVAKCIEESIGTSFVSLLGHRFGNHMIQPQVLKSEFEDVTELYLERYGETEDYKNYFGSAKYWVLDSTYDPPSYRLQHLSKINEDVWNSANKEIKKMLQLIQSVQFLRIPELKKADFDVLKTKAKNLFRTISSEVENDNTFIWEHKPASNTYVLLDFDEKPYKHVALNVLAGKNAAMEIYWSKYDECLDVIRKHFDWSLDEKHAKFQSAVTAFEVQRGVLAFEKEVNHRRVLCYFRNIDDVEDINKDVYEQMQSKRRAATNSKAKLIGEADVNQQLKIINYYYQPEMKRLLQALKSELGEKTEVTVFEKELNRLKPFIPYTFDETIDTEPESRETKGYPPQWKDYIDRFATSFVKKICLQAMPPINNRPIQDPKYREPLLHYETMLKLLKSKGIERKDPLDTIEKYVSDAPHTHTRESRDGPAKELPLIVTGSPGCGKSWLLARSVEYINRVDPDAIVIYRFIGTTMRSSDIFNLIKSIFEQLLSIAVSETDQSQVNDNEEDKTTAPVRTAAGKSSVVGGGFMLTKKDKQKRIERNEEETKAAHESGLYSDGLRHFYHPDKMNTTAAFRLLKDFSSHFCRFHNFSNKKIVIMLDSLEQLPQTDLTDYQFQRWWPSLLPSNIRLIISCVKNDTLKSRLPCLSNIDGDKNVIDLNTYKFEMTETKLSSCFEAIWDSRTVQKELIPSKRKINGFFKMLLVNLWKLCPADARSPLFMTILVDQVMTIRFKENVKAEDMAELNSDFISSGNKSEASTAFKALYNKYEGRLYDTGIDSINNLKKAAKLGARGLIHLIFEKIEQIHTIELAQFVFGIMALRKDGISELELEQIAPEDFVWSQFKFWVTPNKQLPPLIVTRMLYELENYIVERMSGGVLVKTWFHQEFAKVAKERYIDTPTFDVRVSANEGDKGFGRIESIEILNPPRFICFEKPNIFISKPHKGRPNPKQSLGPNDPKTVFDVAKAICEFNSPDSYEALLQAFEENFERKPFYFTVASGNMEQLEEDLSKLARNHRKILNETYHILSLHDGEDNFKEKYKTLLRTATSRGHWVLLHNCHFMSAEFLAELNVFIKSLLTQPNKDFRLFISTETISSMPFQSLLDENLFYRITRFWHFKLTKGSGYAVGEKPDVVVGSEWSLLFGKDKLQGYLHKLYMKIANTDSKFESVSAFRKLIYLLDRLDSISSESDISDTFNESRTTFRSYVDHLVNSGRNENNLHKLQELAEIAYQFDEIGKSKKIVDESKSEFYIFSEWMIRHVGDLENHPTNVKYLTLFEPIFNERRSFLHIRPKPQLSPPYEKEVFSGDVSNHVLVDPIKACSWSKLREDIKGNFAYCTEDKCFIGQMLCNSGTRVSHAFNWQHTTFGTSSRINSFCVSCGEKKSSFHTLKCICQKVHYCEDCIKKYEKCKQCKGNYVKQCGNLVDICWSKDPKYPNLLLCLNESSITYGNEIYYPLVLLSIPSNGQEPIEIYADLYTNKMKKEGSFIDEDEIFLSVEWVDNKVPNVAIVVLTSHEYIYVARLGFDPQALEPTVARGKKVEKSFEMQIINKFANNDLTAIWILRGINTCMKYRFHSHDDNDDDDDTKVGTRTSKQQKFIIIGNWWMGKEKEILESKSFVSPSNSSFQIEEISKYKSHLNFLVSWASNNEYFAISCDKVCDIWYSGDDDNSLIDPKNKGKILRRKTRISGHQSTITGVCWAPCLVERKNPSDTSSTPRHSNPIMQHILATCSEDRTISTWNTDGVCLSVIIGHQGHVSSISWNRSATNIFSCGSFNCGKAKIWDVKIAEDNFKAINKEDFNYPVVRGNKVLISSMAVSPDFSRIAVSSHDEYVYIYKLFSIKDLKDKKKAEEIKLSGARGEIRQMCWSPCGKYLATSNNILVRVWNIESVYKDKNVNDLYPVNDWHFKDLFQSVKYRAVDVRNYKKDKYSATYIRNTEWSPDGAFIAATCEDGSVTIWNLFEANSEPQKLKSDLYPTSDTCDLCTDLHADIKLIGSKTAQQVKTDDSLSKLFPLIAWNPVNSNEFVCTIFDRWYLCRRELGENGLLDEKFKVVFYKSESHSRKRRNSIESVKYSPCGKYIAMGVYRCTCKTKYISHCWTDKCGPERCVLDIYDLELESCPKLIDTIKTSNSIIISIDWHQINCDIYRLLFGDDSGCILSYEIRTGDKRSKEIEVHQCSGPVVGLKWHKELASDANAHDRGLKMKSLVFTDNIIAAFKSGALSLIDSSGGGQVEANLDSSARKDNQKSSLSMCICLNCGSPFVDGKVLKSLVKTCFNCAPPPTLKRLRDLDFNSLEMKGHVFSSGLLSQLNAMTITQLDQGHDGLQEGREIFAIKTSSSQLDSKENILLGKCDLNYLLDINFYQDTDVIVESSSAAGGGSGDDNDDDNDAASHYGSEVGSEFGVTRYERPKHKPKETFKGETGDEYLVYAEKLLKSNIKDDLKQKLKEYDKFVRGESVELQVLYWPVLQDTKFEEARKNGIDFLTDKVYKTFYNLKDLNFHLVFISGYLCLLNHRHDSGVLKIFTLFSRKDREIMIKNDWLEKDIQGHIDGLSKNMSVKVNYEKKGPEYEAVIKEIRSYNSYLIEFTTGFTKSKKKSLRLEHLKDESNRKFIDVMPTTGQDVMAYFKSDADPKSEGKWLPGRIFSIKLEKELIVTFEDDKFLDDDKVVVIGYAGDFIYDYYAIKQQMRQREISCSDGSSPFEDINQLLDSLANPLNRKICPILEKSTTPKLEIHLSKNLNKKQQSVIENLKYNVEAIQGPPGTGKSRLLPRIVWNYTAPNGYVTLVTTVQNDAIDAIVNHFAQFKQTEENNGAESNASSSNSNLYFFVVGANENMSPEAKKWTLRNQALEFDEIKKLQEYIDAVFTLAHPKDFSGLNEDEKQKRIEWVKGLYKDKENSEMGKIIRDANKVLEVHERLRILKNPKKGYYDALLVIHNPMLITKYYQKLVVYKNFALEVFQSRLCSKQLDIARRASAVICTTSAISTKLFNDQLARPAVIRISSIILDEAGNFSDVKVAGLVKILTLRNIICMGDQSQLPPYSVDPDQEKGTCPHYKNPISTEKCKGREYCAFVDRRRRGTGDICNKTCRKGEKCWFEHWRCPDKYDELNGSPLLESESELSIFIPNSGRGGLLERLASKLDIDMLLMQYRMPSRLGNFINERFYKRDHNGRNLYNGKSLIEGNQDPYAMYFIDYTKINAAADKDDKKPFSFFNQEEISIILLILRRMFDSGSESIYSIVTTISINDIGESIMSEKFVMRRSVMIITFYKLQEDKIKEAVKDEKLRAGSSDKHFKTFLEKIEVMTVDQALGKEADIVMLSCVRAEIEKGKKNTINFLTFSRLNVSLSRAKANLIVIGNYNKLRENTTFEYLKRCIDPAAFLLYHNKTLYGKGGDSSSFLSKLGVTVISPGTKDVDEWFSARGLDRSSPLLLENTLPSDNIFADGDNFRFMEDMQTIREYRPQLESANDPAKIRELRGSLQKFVSESLSSYAAAAGARIRSGGGDTDDLRSLFPYEGKYMQSLTEISNACQRGEVADVIMTVAKLDKSYISILYDGDDDNDLSSVSGVTPDQDSPLKGFSAFNSNYTSNDDDEDDSDDEVHRFNDLFKQSEDFCKYIRSTSATSKSDFDDFLLDDGEKSPSFRPVASKYDKRKGAIIFPRRSNASPNSTYLCQYYMGCKKETCIGWHYPSEPCANEDNGGECNYKFSCTFLHQFQRKRIKGYNESLKTFRDGIPLREFFKLHTQGLSSQAFDNCVQVQPLIDDGIKEEYPDMSSNQFPLLKDDCVTSSYLCPFSLTCNSDVCVKWHYPSSECFILHSNSIKTEDNVDINNNKELSRDPPSLSKIGHQFVKGEKVIHKYRRAKIESINSNNGKATISYFDSASNCLYLHADQRVKKTMVGYGDYGLLQDEYTDNKTKQTKQKNYYHFQWVKLDAFKYFYKALNGLCLQVGGNLYGSTPKSPPQQRSTKIEQPKVSVKEASGTGGGVTKLANDDGNVSYLGGGTGGGVTKIANNDADYSSSNQMGGGLQSDIAIPLSNSTQTPPPLLSHFINASTTAINPGYTATASIEKKVNDNNGLIPSSFDLLIKSPVYSPNAAISLSSTTSSKEQLKEEFKKLVLTMLDEPERGLDDGESMMCLQFLLDNMIRTKAAFVALSEETFKEMLDASNCKLPIPLKSQLQEIHRIIKRDLKALNSTSSNNNNNGNNNNNNNNGGNSGGGDRDNSTGGGGPGQLGGSSSNTLGEGQHFGGSFLSGSFILGTDAQQGGGSSRSSGGGLLGRDSEFNDQHGASPNGKSQERKDLYFSRAVSQIKISNSLAELSGEKGNPVSNDNSSQKSWKPPNQSIRGGRSLKKDEDSISEMSDNTGYSKVSSNGGKNESSIEERNGFDDQEIYVSFDKKKDHRFSNYPFVNWAGDKSKKFLQELLKRIFASCGDQALRVTNCVCSEKGTRRDGLVRFESPELAQDASDNWNSRYSINGCEIRVVPSPGYKSSVKILGYYYDFNDTDVYGTWERNLRELFGCHGNIISVGTDIESRDGMWVEFEDEAAAVEAVICYEMLVDKKYGIQFVRESDKLLYDKVFDFVYSCNATSGGASREVSWSTDDHCINASAFGLQFYPKCTEEEIHRCKSLKKGAICKMWHANAKGTLHFESDSSLPGLNYYKAVLQVAGSCQVIDDKTLYDKLFAYISSQKDQVMLASEFKNDYLEKECSAAERQRFYALEIHHRSDKLLAFFEVHGEKVAKGKRIKFCPTGKAQPYYTIEEITGSTKAAGKKK